MTVLERLIGWSLDRPRLIALGCLWVLAWGAHDVGGMAFDLLPNLAPAELRVQTEAPGLVAEQVESLVTHPVETSLIGTPGVGHVSSESVQGLSIVTIGFAPGVDAMAAREVVSESLSTLAGALPDGVAQPRVAPITSGDAEVIRIGFTSATLDPMTLRDIVQWTVRPRLLAAPGVAKVAIYGGRTRQIEVRARPADLSDSDLGFLDIVRAVSRATSVAGAGFIDTPSQRIVIEPHGQALTPQSVGAGQIQTPGAAPVRIEDVSDVAEEAAPAFGDALIAGRPGVLVDVARQYGANGARTTRAVERALAVLAPALAAQGVTVRTDLDRPATFQAAALKGVTADLLIGAALVVVVLALALRQPRALLVAVIGIPLAFVMAVAAIKALGWSLNLMTLGGMAVGLGIAIDDGVIDVENILERLGDTADGAFERRRAVLRAALEVRGPVIYATLAVIIGLTPLIALKGPHGALLAPLAVSIAAVSMASLLVAVFVTPSLCLLFLRRPGRAGVPGRARWLEDAHGRWVSRLSRRPPIILGLAALAAVVAIGAALTFRPEFLPRMHDGHLVVSLTGPSSTSIDTSREVGAHIADDLGALGGVRAVSQRIGRDDTGDDSWGPERSVIDIELATGLGAAAQDRLADRVRLDLAPYAGFAPQVRTRSDSGALGPATATPFQLRLFGQDLDALRPTAIRIADLLREIPGAGEVGVVDEPRGPVVRVDIDFSRLALYGLSSADVLDTIQAAFAGERVGRIYNGGRVIDLAVSGPAALRRDPEGVGELLLRSTSGISTPLKNVANVYLTDGRAEVDHDDGLRRILITADPRDADAFADAARGAVSARVVPPRGAFLEFGRGDGASWASGGDFWIDVALAASAMIALLTIAFDGRTAAVIIGASLLSMTGGVVAVLLAGGVVSLGSAVGFITLFGLSMRNGILVFSRLEDLILREQAHWTLETVIRSVRERLTPILLTGLLLFVALAPLAVHAGAAGREILGPMSLVIIGGVCSGTVTSVLVLPTMIFAFWRPAYARRPRRRAG